MTVIDINTGEKTYKAPFSEDRWRSEMADLCSAYRIAIVDLNVSLSILQKRVKKLEKNRVKNRKWLGMF